MSKTYIERMALKIFEKIKNNIILGIILLIAICISQIFYSGIYNISDDVRVYLINLQAILDGNFMELEPPLRLPLLALEVLAYFLFKQNIELIPYAFSMCFPLIILLVYILMHMLFNKKTALISCFFVLTVHTIYTYGGTILPDNITLATVLFAYIFLVKALKSKTKNGEALYFILCGLACFCTFILKEFCVLLFAGFFPLVLAYNKKIWYCALRVGLIFFIVFIPYKIILALVSNSFTLTTFAEFPMANNQLAIKHFYDYNIKRGSATIPTHFVYAIKCTYRNSGLITVLQTSLIILMIGFSIKDKKAIYLVFPFAAMGLFLGLAFGSLSLTTFIPVPLSPRYFIGVNTFLAMQLGVVLHRLDLLKIKSFFIAMLFIFISVFWVVCAQMPTAGIVGSTLQYKGFQEIVATGYDIYDKPTFVYSDTANMELNIQAEQILNPQHKFKNWADIDIKDDYNQIIFVTYEEDEMINKIRMFAKENKLEYIELKKNRVKNNSFLKILFNTNTEIKPMYYGFLK